MNVSSARRPWEPGSTAAAPATSAGRSARATPMIVSAAQVSAEPLVTCPPSTSQREVRRACGYGPHTSVEVARPVGSDGSSISATIAEEVPDTSETSPAAAPPQASRETWASMPPTATGAPGAMPSAAAAAGVTGPASDPTGRITSGSCSTRSGTPSAAYRSTGKRPASAS